MIKEKLNGQSGESIGETLVALLIAALALVMLAGAISASLGVVLDIHNMIRLICININGIIDRSKG